MFGRIRMAALLPVAMTGLFGCAGVSQVRYVYQDGQSGVIGMPENTSHWPTFYRKHAEELMAQHFPEGYEVVRAEEVVEGSRTLTVKGSNSAEIEPSSASHLLALGKLGRTSTRSQSDQLKIKECRILYKKTGPLKGDYAEQAAWTPAPYVDPNAPERRSASAKPAGAGKPEPHEPEAVAKAPAPDDSPRDPDADDAPAPQKGRPATRTAKKVPAPDIL